MGRKKGTPKTGGRKKGTPNKITGTLQEFITNLIDENREQIVKDIKVLDSKDRLLILSKFIPFVIPKQSDIKIENNAFEELMKELDAQEYEK